MIGVLKILVLAVLVGVGAWKSIKHNKASGDFVINKQVAAVIAGCVLVLLLLFPAVGEIPAGYRGVVLRFGGVTGRVLNEGIYFVTPLADNIVLMNVQTRAYTVSARSASKDLQDVETEVTLNYAVERDQAATVYQNLRQEYIERIVFPAVHESIKAVTANFEAENLITERPVVKEKIENSLKERIEEYGIQLQAVSITDFQFSAEFTSAIEDKVIASQRALKAERDLDRIKIEAAQQIESAKAEAEALRLQRENISADLIELRRIEVQRRALEKWDGVLPKTITGNVPLPFIGIQ